MDLHQPAYIFTISKGNRHKRKTQSGITSTNLLHTMYWKWKVKQQKIPTENEDGLVWMTTK